MTTYANIKVIYSIKQTEVITSVGYSVVTGTMQTLWFFASSLSRYVFCRVLKFLPGQIVLLVALHHI